MRKLIHCLGLVASIFLLGSLSACTLYFGGDDADDSYTYCGPDGQYECAGGDCYWSGPTCDDGGNGYDCSSDSQCAAGCYCGSGTCVEAGYCSADADCGFGYTCDEGRSSCVPADRCDDLGSCPTGYLCDGSGVCQPLGCDANADCASGCFCADDSSLCEESCYCSSDADAQGQSWGWCDEARSTCMPGTDPNHGSCAGEITCNLAVPGCPADSVPLIKDGCYTGQCQPLNMCDMAPSCEVLNTETSCLQRQDCYPEYNGQNCHTTTGAACTSGSGSNCICESFTFDECNVDAP